MKRKNAGFVDAEGAVNYSENSFVVHRRVGEWEYSCQYSYHEGNGEGDSWEYSYEEEFAENIGKFEKGTSYSRNKKRRRNLENEKAKACKKAMDKSTAVRRRAMEYESLTRLAKYGNNRRKSYLDSQLKYILLNLQNEREFLLYLIEEESIHTCNIQRLIEAGENLKLQLFYTKKSMHHNEDYANLLPNEKMMVLLKMNREAIKHVERTLKRLEKLQEQKRNK